jgi:hypothetical protein
MSVVMHIGQPKAASTSLQHALWSHRDLLGRAGISYLPRRGEQHGPQVIDFLWPHLSAVRAQWGTFMGRQSRVPGGWSRLCEDVAHARASIVSAEYLTMCTARQARVVVSDLCGSGDRPVIVLCVRAPSGALPSAYSQTARVQLTVGFETWVRAAVRQSLLPVSGRPGALLANLVNPDLVSVWEPLGTLRQVQVEAPAFEETVLQALGIADIVPRPFLARRNVSPSAACLIAWQRVLGQARGTDLPRFPDRRVAEFADDGSRFRLRPDVAGLVDAAFPTAAGDVAESRRQLLDRLQDPSPMTRLVAGDDFEESVRRWVTRLQ